MFWLVTICVVALFTVPLVAALLESMWMRRGSRDVGFWGWARLVGGTCHVPWGRQASPIIRFDLPDGEARGRATKGAGLRRWRVELRAYQDSPFGFAARLCTPPEPPLRWRTPGLTQVELFNEDVEFLSDYSFETTDEQLLRWLLRHIPTREALEHLQANCGAERLQVILANSEIVLRADSPKNWKVGSAVEHIGPPLVDMMRKLSSNLSDLANAMTRSGEFQDEILVCPACGQSADEEPERCTGCGTYVHRGCIEMVGGCPTLDCEFSPDALPGLSYAEPKELVTADA